MRKFQATLALILCLTLSLSLLSSCAARKSEASTTTTATSSEAVTTTAASAAPVDPSTGKSQTADVNLYPASDYVEGLQKWGYIDRSGQFVIKPAYDQAYDFQANGLAKFSKDNLVGLLNAKGETVVQPIYNDIGDFADDLAIAWTWGQTTTSTLLDTSGKVVFQKDLYISDFNEGLAAAYFQDAKSGSGKYGYVDLKGAVAIKAQYDSAGDFADGKALVSSSDGQQFYIDKTGKKVADYQAPDSGSQLMYNKEFPDGLKIAGRQADYKDYYGLFGNDGQALIKDDYAGIERLSDNLFAVAKQTGDIFWYSGLPKALFNKTGKQLSDFIFYDITDANEGFFSVSDLNSTYLIDADGQVYAKLPKVQGNGTLLITKGLVKAMVDQELSYYTLEGQLVYAAGQSYQLGNGLQVTRQKLSPDRFLLVHYPEISGLADSSVQSTINNELKDAFTGEDQFLNMDGSKMPDGTAYITVDFTAEINQDLLVIHKTGYLYPIGAAHGQPTSQYFHFDVRTGKIYELKDLFKAGVDYKATLERLISLQILRQEEKGEAIYDDKNPPLTAANFLVSRDHLELFYSPYEIAAYAAGFPTFSIPFSELNGLIATDGELWNAFAK